jgi:hypothetical protein
MDNLHAAEMMLAACSRKRMRSGDRPGLQNRRAAGFLSPVCSTHTRFRQFVFHEFLRFCGSATNRWVSVCEAHQCDESEMRSKATRTPKARYSFGELGAGRTRWCACSRLSLGLRRRHERGWTQGVSCLYQRGRFHDPSYGRRCGRSTGPKEFLRQGDQKFKGALRPY